MWLRAIQRRAEAGIRPVGAILGMPLDAECEMPARQLQGIHRVRRPGDNCQPAGHALMVA
jgi:hypothetical protein